MLRLQDRLYSSLKHRQGRTTPLCAVREELFSGAFDELVRQVVLGCPERGLLLMRLRDEARMTLAAYKTMFLTSTEYGLKAVKQQAGTDELQAEADQLAAANQRLKTAVFELQALQECIQEDGDRAVQTLRRRHQETVAALAAQNAQLTKFLGSTSK